MGKLSIFVKFWLLALLCLQAWGAGGEEWQSLSAWRAIPEGSACSLEEGALRFETGPGAKEIYPLCRVAAGELGEVHALRFDIRYQGAPDARFFSHVLLYSQSQKKNIHFTFKISAPEVWQTVTVKLEHPAVEREALKHWQFSFSSSQPGLAVWVKNLQCLDAQGRVLGENASETESAPVAPSGEDKVKVEVPSPVDFLEESQWRAFPEGSACSLEEGAMRFETGEGAKEMYPLCHIPAGAFARVHALRFDIRYHAAPEARFFSHVLLYSQSQKKNIHCTFKVSAPEVWQSVTVKLDHPAVEREALKYWQFSFSSSQPGLTVWVKNFQCLDAEGKEILFLGKKKRM